VVVSQARQLPVHDLPEEALLFLLGSRYCETDRLSETAWNLFGNAPTGWDRVWSYPRTVDTLPGDFIASNGSGAA